MLNACEASPDYTRIWEILHFVQNDKANGMCIPIETPPSLPCRATVFELNNEEPYCKDARASLSGS